MTAEIVAVIAQPDGLSPRQSALPALIKRARGAGRFAWEEFFYAEHHTRKRLANCTGVLGIPSSGLISGHSPEP
jgi:hypothetical protein